MDQLPRLGKREPICLLLFTCNYVVSVWRGFLFLWELGIGYVILLWHSLSLHIIILVDWNSDLALKAVLTSQSDVSCIILTSAYKIETFYFFFFY